MSSCRYLNCIIPSKDPHIFPGYWEPESGIIGERCLGRLRNPEPYKSEYPPSPPPPAPLHVTDLDRGLGVLVQGSRSVLLRNWRLKAYGQGFTSCAAIGNVLVSLLFQSLRVPRSCSQKTCPKGRSPGPSGKGTPTGSENKAKTVDSRVCAPGIHVSRVFYARTGCKHAAYVNE